MIEQPTPELKDQILDGLREVEIMILENSPTAEKEVSNTVDWLGQDVHRRRPRDFRGSPANFDPMIGSWFSIG